MAIQTKPNIQIPWAETGNKTSVSEAKLRQGWIAEIPPAEIENYYQNRQDLAIIHTFQTGIPVWDINTQYTANRSYVQASNGAIFVAAGDNVGQNPLTTTSWRLLIDNASMLVNNTRTISTGYGLQGGGDLTVNRTISLANSGVANGEYGSTGSVPRILVDSAGRIVSASNIGIDFTTPINSALASRSIVAGFGLQGGGNLSANRTLALDTVNSGTPGQYGDSSTVAQVTIDTYGRVTNTTNVPINFSGPISTALAGRTISTGVGLQGGGNLSADRTISLSNTGVGSGSYGTSSAIPVFSVDAQGRITTATNQSIDFTAPMQDRNYGTNGHQMFPAGFLMQWCMANIPFGTDTFVAFPRSFPNSCLSVMLTPSANYGSIQESGLSVVSTSSTGVTVRHNYLGDNGGATTTITARILAVGF